MLNFNEEEENEIDNEGSLENDKEYNNIVKYNLLKLNEDIIKNIEELNINKIDYELNNV